MAKETLCFLWESFLAVEFRSSLYAGFQTLWWLSLWMNVKFRCKALQFYRL